MKFFEYLSTTQDQNRFVFYVLIGFCLLECGIALFNGWRSRKSRS